LKIIICLLKIIPGCSSSRMNSPFLCIVSIIYNSPLGRSVSCDENIFPDFKSIDKTEKL
jgi:hypothetical protein